MQKIKLYYLLPVLILSALFLAGPTFYGDTVVAGEKAAAAKDENVYKGKILGVSKKAKTISIKVGDKTQMVKFNDDTKGMEHAKKGEAAIIKFEPRGKDKIAKVVKPKLAKLPKGVKEMQPEDLAKYVAKGPEKGNYLLVDSRPAKRFAEGTIPTSISIPVPKMKKSGKDLMPADKDKLLIFYCGGPT